MYDNSYNYDSTYGSSAASTPDAGTMLAIFGVIAVISIIAYVVTSFFLSKVFKKAGIPGWKAWVPIYNQWVFLELGGQHGWISLLYLAGVIPFVGFIGTIVATVFSCIAAYRIGLNFGKEGVFVLLYIFLSIVWIIWLAVDKTAVWRPGLSTSSNNVPPTTMPPSEPMSTPDQPTAM
jgi:hypothetical protein